MLINVKIIFDRYYYINFAQIKEIMVHYILKPGHILICVALILVPVGLQLLIISMCFAWCPVKSINKCGVYTAHTHVNCHINTNLFSSLIYTC